MASQLSASGVCNEGLGLLLLFPNRESEILEALPRDYGLTRCCVPSAKSSPSGYCCRCAIESKRVAGNKPMRLLIDYGKYGIAYAPSLFPFVIEPRPVRYSPYSKHPLE